MIRTYAILAALVVATPCSAEDSSIFTDRDIAFPGGRTKALILSYEDGPDQDVRFVELLNRHGIVGTFHLNSGRLGLEAEWMTELIGDPGWYVSAEDLPAVYSGHEIGSHTVNHPHLTQLDLAEVVNEISRDVAMLEQLSGAPVESFAYPFGDFDDRVVDALGEAPISSARTVESTGTFELPHDFLRWHPTAQHAQALNLVDDFLSLNGDSPALFMIWGHSWEFDGESEGNNWRHAESLIEKLSGHDDIWYVTIGEFVRYIDAVKDVDQVGADWVNLSDVSVWIRAGDRLRQLAPVDQNSHRIHPALPD